MLIHQLGTAKKQKNRQCSLGSGWVVYMNFGGCSSYRSQNIDASPGGHPSECYPSWGLLNFKKLQARLSHGLLLEVNNSVILKSYICLLICTNLSTKTAFILPKVHALRPNRRFSTVFDNSSPAGGSIVSVQSFPTLLKRGMNRVKNCDCGEIRKIPSDDRQTRNLLAETT